MIETAEWVAMLDSVTVEEVRTMASTIAAAPRVATLVGPVLPAAAAALDRALC